MLSPGPALGIRERPALVPWPCTLPARILFGSEIALDLTFSRGPGHAAMLSPLLLGVPGSSRANRMARPHASIKPCQVLLRSASTLLYVWRTRVFFLRAAQGLPAAPVTHLIRLVTLTA